MARIAPRGATQSPSKLRITANGVRRLCRPVHVADVRYRFEVGMCQMRALLLVEEIRATHVKVMFAAQALITIIVIDSLGLGLLC